MNDIEAMAKEYALAKDNGNKEAMNEIKGKLRSGSVDRDSFYELVEKEEARIISEKESKIKENNKRIDESVENIISDVINQNIVKAESNIIVTSIEKFLKWVFKELRLCLSDYMYRRYRFLIPYANLVSNEVVDLTYRVMKSFLNLLAHALINGNLESHIEYIKE